jgi:hypothetical protein
MKPVLSNLQHKLKLLLIPVLLTAFLAGCGGGGDSPVINNGNSGNDSGNNGNSGNNANSDASQINQLTVDASAGGFPPDPSKGYTYVDLVHGKVLNLSDAEAAHSSDWQVAFRRTDSKVNGGVSGPLGASGAIALTPPGFYDTKGDPIPSYFKDPNQSPSAYLPAFESVTADQASSLSFMTDSDIPFISGDGDSDSWFSYDTSTHTLSPNTGNWWLVRSADGNSYGKFHATAIDQTNGSITLELYLQRTGENGFAGTPVTWTSTALAGNGQRCFDFDSASEVDCQSQAGNWDLMFEASNHAWNLWTNGGVRGNSGDKGGAFGVLDATTAAGYSSGSSAYNYFVDSSGGVFATNGTTYNWAYYSGGKLYPNYRVYVIKTPDQGSYALQILSYYNTDSGASGFYTLRFHKL